MATYSDTLNQTFPRISSNNDEELHRTFHTPSTNTKSAAFNFEQQFLFGKKIKEKIFFPTSDTKKAAIQRTSAWI